jgi:WD40 repeat protein
MIQAPELVEEEFFVAGGTLRVGIRSYVTRPADEELVQAALTGEFCYVLTPRQMGKSSLMVRAAQQLQAADVRTIILDLTSIGTIVTPEQWYLGLISRINSRLNPSFDVTSWWQEQYQLGVVQRFTSYIRELLRQLDQHLVIFFDEIDTMLSFDFRDDFFAAIRYFYNMRSDEPEFQQLSIVLLGVATPSDLARDRKRTPFNIGRGIELHEFSRQDTGVLEAELAAIFSNTGKAVFDRIYYWTNGHPYLTQKLCLAASKDERCAESVEQVDILVNRLFLSEAARRVTNLQSIRDNVQAMEPEERQQLLRLYRRVLSGKQVPEDERSATQNRAKILGLVRGENGFLRVRNRIYEHAFDKRWIKKNVPANWWELLPRSIRIAAISIVLLLIAFIAATLFAVRYAQTAEEETRLALSRQLIAESKASASSQYDLSLLLGLEALRTINTTETQGIVRYALPANPYISTFLRSGDEPVNSVALSRGGRLLATGSSSGKILLWDTKDRALVSPILEGHQFQVDSMIFTGDSHYLISTSCADVIDESNTCSSGELAFWNLRANGELIKTKQAHDNPSRAIVIDANDHLLASGGGSSLILWDLVSFEPVWQLDGGQANEVISLALSPTDPNLLVYGDKNGRIYVVDLTAQTIVLEFEAHGDWVTSVAFSPNGQLLGSSSRDGTIALWDTSSWEPTVLPITAHTGSVYDLEFTTNSSFITTGADSRVVQWKVSDDGVSVVQDAGSLDGHGGPIWSMSVADTPDGHLLATNGPDSSAILWSLNGDRSRGRWLTGHQGAVLGIDFSPDGSVLASASEDQTVRLWDVKAYLPIGDSLKAHQDAVRRVAFHPQGQYLASGGRDNKVVLWDLISGQLNRRELIGHESIVRGLVFSPDGQTLASSDDSGTIMLWDVERAERIGEPLKRHSREIFDIDISPDGNLLAAGYWDGMVQLWEMENAQPLGDIIPTGLKQIWDVEFSPAGSTLAVVGSGEVVPLIDVASRRVQSRLLTHQANRINAVAFSPDGSLLATGGSDSTIVVWDVSSRHAVGLPLTMHSDEISALQFSLDGKVLASADRGGNIFLSVVEYDDPVQAICSIASRNLTREEWSQYIGVEVEYREICPDHKSTLSDGPVGLR